MEHTIISTEDEIEQVKKAIEEQKKQKELDKLKNLNENPDQKLNIPVKTDGTTFELPDLQDTQ